MATKDAERTYVNRRCLTCNALFQVQGQSVLRGEGRYCSHKCNPNYADANRARIKNPLGSTHDVVSRVCPTCSTEFKTKVKNINRGGGVYCCLKCNPNKAASTTLEQKVDRRRAYNLRRNYGLTIEQYEQLLKDQGGVCAICSEVSTNPRSPFLFVDHCHSTERVRGLLCGPCNSAIGLLKEREDLFRKAVAYLS